MTTRFAPSPTGRLHLGHAYSAVVGHALARQSGGRFLLRIEDLDQGRSRPEFAAAIAQDLEWLGLGWDCEPLVQSQRSATYAAALDRLRRDRLVYPCFCTRADIAAALSAPHGPPSGHYPGTCRGLPDEPARRESTPHCWRLDSAAALARVGPPSWRELDGGLRHGRPGELFDVILARKDAPGSYHLACVVDDAATGVTLVARGADLAASTPIQRLLQQLLGLPEPLYRHHPLVVHRGGRRLAKRDRAPHLALLREQGVDGRQLADRLLAGQLPDGFAFA